MGMKVRVSVAAATARRAPEVSLERARALWCRKQGLAPPMGGDPLHVVVRTGWLRTLAGIDAYLAVRARAPELKRADMDQQIVDGALRVAPAARGCVHIIPGVHRGLALALARSWSLGRDTRDLARAGVDAHEVERLASTVHESLVARGPSTTAELRKTLPAGAVRHLGPEGKRVGLSSPLPVALRVLELDGRIARTLTGGRLDDARYRWRALRTEGDGLARSFTDVAARARALVRLFLTVAGPASTRHMAEWTGLSQADIHRALASLEVEEVDLVRPGGGVLRAVLLADDMVPLLDEDTAPPAGFSFLSFEDNLLVAHGGPAVHVPPDFFDVPVTSRTSGQATSLGRVRHLGLRALFRGHELCGLWEFDPDEGEVVCATFRSLPARELEVLGRERQALARFIREELGHARSSSVDTDDAVRRRAAAVRAMDHLSP